MNRHARPIAATILALMAISTGASAKPHPGKPADSAPVAQGDASAGSDIFKTRCAACHGKQGEGGALAPPLLGVVGAKAASSPFAGYTAALKASGAVWSPAKLDGFLAGPGKLIPGTAMIAIVPKAEDRQNLIAHLATLKR